MKKEDITNASVSAIEAVVYGMISLLLGGSAVIGVILWLCSR